jgi:hypothetical protein
MTLAMMKDLNPPTPSMSDVARVGRGSFLPFGRAVARSPRQQRPGHLARSRPHSAGSRPFSIPTKDRPND